MVNLDTPNFLVGSVGTRQAMSLQIQIQEIVVGEWLAVPQTQRNSLIIPLALLNLHS
jgi:hypothetical protein